MINLPEFYNLTKQKFDNIDLNLEIIKIFLNRLQITKSPRALLNVECYLLNVLLCIGILVYFISSVLYLCIYIYIYIYIYI